MGDLTVLVFSAFTVHQLKIRPERNDITVGLHRNVVTIQANRHAARGRPCFVQRHVLSQIVPATVLGQRVLLRPCRERVFISVPHIRAGMVLIGRTAEIVLMLFAAAALTRARVRQRRCGQQRQAQGQDHEPAQQTFLHRSPPLVFPRPGPISRGQSGIP